MSFEPSTELTRSLDRAKIGLLEVKNSVFISTILFSLKFSWDESIPTACTNGLNLKVSPKFWEPLSKDERVFLLAHEAWHVAFQHMTRVDPVKEENFSVWNQACDHYINIMLINAGYSMIKGGLADHTYHDQTKWSADTIFKHLMDNPNKQDPNFEPDFTGDGEPGDPDMSPEEVQRKIEDIVIKASVQSKMSGNDPGSIPGEIDIELDRLLNPKLPWNIILQNFMSSYAKEDYSFRKPNKRFMPNVIMPSLFSESVGHIAVAVDTSCSVSDEQFAAFRTEIVTIHQTLQPEELTVVDFDTKIHKVHKLHKGDDASTIKFSGRGGTYLKPVFDHYNKKENNPVVLIVFSDLECDEIEDDPGYPVIWVKLKGCGFTPTFGQLIDYDA
jgi:predicted metal-dependent peptidase